MTVTFNRTKWTDKSVTEELNIESFSNGTLSNTYTSEFTTVHDTWLTQGVDTPEYFKRKRAGELLPLTHFNQERLYWEGHMNWNISTGNYQQMSNEWIIPNCKLSVEEAKAYSESSEYYVQAAAAKIYSSGFDALTFALELKETANMFHNLVENIRAKSVGSWLTTDFHNLWLEGRYGWRQVYRDMVEITDFINKIDDGRKRFSESVGSSRTFKTTSTNSQNLGAALTYDVITSDTITVGRRGHVVADISPPAIIINPITSWWEVTKLSFVVDWLLNVGQFLESMSFLAYAQQYVASEGMYVKIERNASIDNVIVDTAWNSESTISGHASGYCEWTSRVPTTVAYHPLLEIRLSGLKVLDLVALMVQSKFK